jgi:hypothetical protein
VIPGPGGGTLLTVGGGGILAWDITTDDACDLITTVVSPSEPEEALGGEQPIACTALGR